MGRNNMKKSDEANKETANKVDTKYYDELFKRIKEPNESNDSESIEYLFENVLEEIEENESEMRKCLSSFHIDFFIYKCSFKSFVRLFTLITQNDDRIGTFLADSRISRAYEACLTLIGQKVHDNKAQEDIDDAKSCMERLGNYLDENFDNILETRNGIFTLRAFLKIIGNEDPIEQTPKPFETKKYKKQQQEFSIKSIQPKLLPTEWKLSKFVKKFAKHLDDINVFEYSLVPNVSPFLSLLMRKLFLTYEDFCAQVVEKIHANFLKKPNSFHSMIQDSIGSRFIESYLFSCQSDLLIDHYLSEHLIPNICFYSKHVYANYAVQTLIKQRLPIEPRLNVLFDSLVSNLDSIVDLHTDLTYKHYLIIEMINACQKDSSLDFKALMKSLMNIFGCDSEENRIHFLRALLVFEKMEDITKEYPIDQAFYMFELKPIASTIATKLIDCNDKNISKSFSSLNANEIEFLCTNNVGSHFIEQCVHIFSSKDRSVLLQSLLDKLKGRLLIICTNRSGSYVVEGIWSIANIKQRLAIVEELKSSENQLKNDQYARFFVNKIGLNFYKRKPEEWKAMQTSEFKKRKMFSNLLDEKELSKALCDKEKPIENNQLNDDSNENQYQVIFKHSNKKQKK